MLQLQQAALNSVQRVAVLQQALLRAMAQCVCAVCK
jgi:hypothetical protein